MKIHRPRTPKELLATRSRVDPKGENRSGNHAPLIKRYLLAILDLTTLRNKIDTSITSPNTRWLLGKIPLYWFIPDKLEFELWHRTRNKQPVTNVIIT